MVRKCITYCKIPKISHGAHIYQRLFMRGLFLEGLVRESCVSKSARLILAGKYWGLRLSHASTLSIWTEEIQAKPEQRKTQTAIYYDTFWLQSFGTRNSSLALKKVYKISLKPYHNDKGSYLSKFFKQTVLCRQSQFAPSRKLNRFKILCSSTSLLGELKFSSDTIFIPIILSFIHPFIHSFSHSVNNSLT